MRKRETPEGPDPGGQSHVRYVSEKYRPFLLTLLVVFVPAGLRILLWLQPFLNLLITVACMREPARAISVGTMGVTGDLLTEAYLTGCGSGGSISEGLLPVSKIPTESVIRKGPNLFFRAPAIQHKYSFFSWGWRQRKFKGGVFTTPEALWAFHDLIHWPQQRILKEKASLALQQCLGFGLKQDLKMMKLKSTVGFNVCIYCCEIKHKTRGDDGGPPLRHSAHFPSYLSELTSKLSWTAPHIWTRYSFLDTSILLSGKCSLQPFPSLLPCSPTQHTHTVFCVRWNTQQRVMPVRREKMVYVFNPSHFCFASKWKWGSESLIQNCSEDGPLLRDQRYSTNWSVPCACYLRTAIPTAETPLMTFPDKQPIRDGKKDKIKKLSYQGLFGEFWGKYQNLLVVKNKKKPLFKMCDGIMYNLV